MKTRARPVYLWQQPGWPHLQVDAAALSGVLQAARQRQGEALGLAQALGMPTIDAVLQEVWIREAAATAAIEGEQLDLAAVRSSVMRRLGQGGASGPVSRSVEGLVEVMQDALAGFDQTLDDDRLCRWQSALFPGGTSGIRRIAVGRYRDHADPMQIVSGRPGHEVVHYQASASAEVPQEMARFLAWFEATRPDRGAASPRQPAADGLIRAAIAHLWFETIHPFEDGNGRIGRAIADMALAQDLGAPTRLYSLSTQLLASRSAYYDALNQAQKGTPDVTAWVRWFADALAQACARTTGIMLSALHKQRFWATHSATPLNERQRKVVQKLLDAGDGGFLGGLNAEKYVRLTGASKATATRDLAALLQHGLLRVQGSGKATRYQVNVPEWGHAGVG